MRETIVVDGANATGMFFDEPAPSAIAAAVRRFIDREHEFSPALCHANAARFSEDRFEREFTAFIDQQVAAFDEKLRLGWARQEYALPYVAKAAG